ncbi:MAG: GvpL/GvpF family gas vesicle protein [Bacteroidota bacterium]
MILNRSYLVEKEKGPLFDKAMNYLGTEHQEYLTFRYIGPLPPYSFADIELTQGNFALVDKARKTMQLPEKASFAEIRAACRKLILTHHPDRNPESYEAEERCKNVIDAYEILTTYCQSARPDDARSTLSQGGGLAPMPVYSFNKEEVGKVLIARRGRSSCRAL